MVRSCCVFGCYNRANKSQTRYFYQLPTHGKPEQRLKWLLAIGRMDSRTGQLWQPQGVSHYVCSDHFRTGRPSYEESDRDYVPTIFPKQDAKRNKDKIHWRKMALSTAKHKAIQDAAKAQAYAQEMSEIVKVWEFSSCDACVEGFEAAHQLEIHILSIHKMHALPVKRCMTNTRQWRRPYPRKPVAQPPAPPPLKEFNPYPPYKCSVCGLKFFDQISGTLHLKTHEMDKKMYSILKQASKSDDSQNRSHLINTTTGENVNSNIISQKVSTEPSQTEVRKTNSAASEKVGNKSETSTRQMVQKSPDLTQCNKKRTLTNNESSIVIPRKISKGVALASTVKNTRSSLRLNGILPDEVVSAQQGEKGNCDSTRGKFVQSVTDGEIEVEEKVSSTDAKKLIDSVRIKVEKDTDSELAKSIRVKDVKGNTRKQGLTCEEVLHSQNGYGEHNSTRPLHKSADEEKELSQAPVKMVDFTAKPVVSQALPLYICSQCREEYSTVQELRYHVRLHGFVVCVQCGKYCPSLSGLMKHLALPEHDHLLPCNECGLGLQTQEDLKRHSVLHHIAFSITFEKFERKTYKLFDFLKTVMIEKLELLDPTPHTEDGESDWEVQKELGLVSMITENQNVKREVEEEPDGLSLEDSTPCTPSKQSARKRMQVCLVCREVCIGLDAYKSHVAKAHQPGTVTIPIKLFSGASTESSFKYKTVVDDLKEKAARSSKKLTYEELYLFRCETCDKRFVSMSSLKKHARVHRDFACELCKDAFSSQGELDEHIGRMHLAEKNPVKPVRARKYKFVLCDICGMKTRPDAALANHRARHFEERKYGCGLCDKRFKTLSQCKQHIKQIHTCRKRFQCDKCPKAFATRSCLGMHMRFHDDIRPYPCPSCGRAFHTRQNMRVHHAKYCKGTSRVKSKTGDIVE